MMFFFFAFIVLATAQTCDLNAALTCTQTLASCVGTSTDSGVVCPCARAFVPCLENIGCCSGTFQTACDQQKQYIADNCAAANPCFHMDTIINYKGTAHTYAQIRTNEECSIPHVVEAQGVILTAKCGAETKTLKLTDGHLVYTQRGLQAAGDLKNDDSLYSDLKETATCSIVSITKESKTQQYFGLNCLTSQVLASGIKSSTFEKLHSVPAFWMQIMGRILGVKKASVLGDYIAELVGKINLI